MRIGVLGQVRVWRDGETVSPGPTGQRAVLALLALAGGQPLSRGELVDALWEQSPPASATNVIQTYVKHLRHILEPDRRPRSLSTVLPGVGDGYALRVDAEDIDLFRFRRLVATAAVARRDADPQRAATLLGEALGLWTGAPLADIPVLAGHPKAVALIEERRAALVSYGEAMIAAGAVVDALPVLEEAVAARPLDEAGQAVLIRGYQAAGRRAQAFDQYHEVRRLLSEELGVDPGPELAAAHAALLHGPGETRIRPAAPPVRRAPVPAQLPADVAGFTGRAAELSALDSVLDALDRSAATPGDPAPVTAVVLSGTAGVGKTALAVRWGHRVRQRFPDGQLYVDLRGYDPDRPMPPGDALARFLRALGFAGSDIPLDVDERAACYRSLLNERRMLLVLDNAASVDQVQPLLPGAPSCVALVTSRDLLPALVARHGAHRIGLDLLSPGDAVDLVRVLVGERVDAEPDAVAALAGQCARLPLALRVAGELVLARPAAPLADLVGELADQQRRLELLDAGGNQRTGVQAVFSWSYQHLSPDAAGMFRALGLHPGPDLDLSAAAALSGADRTTARRLLAELTRAHLVHRTGATRYDLHDLLQAYALHLATAEDPEPARQAALARVFDHYLHTAAAAIDLLFPAERHRRPGPPRPDAPTPALPDGHTALSWLDAERANLVATCVHAGAHGWPQQAVRLAVTLLRYLEGGGHYAEASTIYGHGLRAARRVGDRTGEARILTDQAVVLAQQGRHEQAAEHLRGAATICQQTSDTAGEARAVGNLGHIQQRQGRYAEATDHLNRAVDLCRRAGDVTGEARAVGNLGHIHQRQGRYAEATDYLNRSVDLCRRTDDGVGEAYALGSLGLVRSRRGEHDAAIEHHCRALALFQQTGERAGEASALDGLGDAHLRAGRLRLAAEHLDRALLLHRRLGEPAGEARTLNRVGEVREAAGLRTEAYAQHLDALTMAVEIGDRYEEGRAHAGLARSHPAGPDSPLARLHWTQALTVYTALDTPEATLVRAALTANG